VQRQVRSDLCGLGSMRGDPLGQTHFHIPLFAAVWGVLREACVVPRHFTRGYKEVLGASVSRGNMCRFCVFWHASAAGGEGIEGMAAAWRAKTLKYLPTCAKRFKAIVLWLRDANHPGYFADNVRIWRLLFVRC
jgi:AhpD family alkylhydroperoxidase